MVRIDEREYHLVESLIENAGYSEHEDRPGVAKHTLQQSEIHYLERHIMLLAIDAGCHMLVGKLRNEEESDESCADEIEEEDVEDVSLAEIYEEEKVETYIQDDKQKLESSKLYRLLLISKVRERNRLNSVESHHASHHQDVILMVLIAENRADIPDETEDYCKKSGCQDAHHEDGGGEYAVGILVFLVGKAEESGLHAECEDDEYQRNVGIEIGHHAVSTTCDGEHVGIERYEQIIEKPAYDAAHSVDSSIFEKRF